MYFSNTHLVRLNEQIERFWSINESFHDNDLSTSLQEDTALTQLRNEYTICDNNKIQLPCLWQADLPRIAPNFDYAKKRLESLLHSKALSQGNLFEAYGDVFKSWEKDSIIHRIVLERPREEGYYWPHFPVCKPGRETTKIRPVFDGAARHQGVCINDFVLKGPMLMNDLSQVLLRFRRYKYAVQADISQMFLQVLLRPIDKKYHRFLW